MKSRPGMSRVGKIGIPAASFLVELIICGVDRRVLAGHVDINPTIRITITLNS